MASDYAGPRRRAVPPRRLLAAAVLIGAVLGAIVGTFVAGVMGAQRSAALLDLGPAAAAANASGDGTDRFIQSELLYLNSRGFEDQVHVAAGRPEGASLSATQVGSTDVIELAAVAPEAAQAQRMADAAVTSYGTHRETVLTGQVKALQPQLDAARKALTDAQTAAQQADAAAAVSAAQAAGRGDTAAQAQAQAQIGATDLSPLRDRVSALQAQVDAAQAALNSTTARGVVVESGARAGASPTVPKKVGAGVGLALGALLGLVVVAVPRLASRRLWSTEDVPDLDLENPVVRSALPTARHGWRQGLATRRSTDRVESAARLIAARLAEPLTEGRPLVLVGAGGRVGTSFTAVNVATALARRRRTVIVPVGDLDDGRVAGWFGIDENKPGLLKAAQAKSAADVEKLLAKTSVPRLHVLPVARTSHWEQVETALSGPAILLLLAAGWTVVVDCPGGLSTAAFELAPLNPVIGVVAARGWTTAEELTTTVEQLPTNEKSVVAVVLNRPPWRPWRRRSAGGS